MSTPDRPRAFDTGYHMMWSLLDGVTPEQIKAEISLVEQKIRDCNSQISDLNNVRQVKSAKLNVLKKILEREDEKSLRANFKLSEDHKRVIRAINWESENPYKYLYNDEVCKVLNMEKPNDSYSDKQIEYADKILREIPIAVSQFFGKKQ